MTPTILILLLGLGLILVGIGLLGTLVGVRAALEHFSNIEIGIVMAGYYAGYVIGTALVPGIIRNVGHVRTFAAFAALGAASSIALGLFLYPWSWFVLRLVTGLCVVALYMVVESWLNEQSSGSARGRIFSIYMTSTLIALGAGQFLLLIDSPAELNLFAVAAALISLGVIPIAITRVTEPQIDIAEPVHVAELMRISPLGTMGSLASGIVAGAFWGMAPLFGQRLALSETQIALLMSATILGGATLQFPIGHLSDRLDRRIVLILASITTAAVAATSAYVVLHDGYGLIPLAFVYGGLMFSLYGISVAHTNDHLAQGQILEATRGLLLIYGLGALCGPLLGGMAMEVFGAVGLPMLSACTSAMLGLYGLYRITRRSPPPVDAQGEYVAMVRTSPVALEMHPDADPESAPDTARE